MNDYIARIKRTFENLLKVGQAVESKQAAEVELIDLIKKAHRDWEIALNNFDYCVDSDMIDFSIYNIEAAEKKYTCLVKMAKRENKTVNLPMLD